MPTASLDTVTGGTPTPTSWALLCAWQDRAARDEFTHTSFTPFATPAREIWGVALDPVKVVAGDFWGWTPTCDDVQPLAQADPLALFTHLAVRPRYLPAFQLANRRIVRALDGNPAHTLRVGMFELRTRSTFSLWRSLEDAQTFGYRDTVHAPIQKQSRQVPWIDVSFFARFRPSASSGTYQGRDPLAT